MTHVLVVANQTLGGERLAKEIRDRLNAGPCTFHVVVPETPPAELATAWLPADPAIGLELRVAANEDAYEESRRRAQGRLDRLLDEVREAGGRADGWLGAPDPLTAVEDAMARCRVDEVLVSTLPAGLSRWLKLDLPSRLERRLDVPITTIIAD